MRSYSHILIFFVFAMSSCVTRIDAPQEGQAQLHIEMEMMRTHELTATLKTSNILSGIFPIEHPEDANIQVSEPGDIDNNRKLVWDEERELYALTLPAGDPLLTPNRTVRLKAFIDGSEFKEIKSETKVPNFGKLENQESLESKKYVDPISGEEFWQRNFRFTPMDLYPNQAIYYQLILEEQLSSININGLDTSYTDITDFPTKLEILSVNHGNEAIKRFDQQEGLFIKMQDLESEYIEVSVRSTEPVYTEDVVTKFISTNLISITEDSYEYHRGLHNIKKSGESIFGEAALYRSNIENGVGVFTACVLKNDHFYIK